MLRSFVLSATVAVPSALAADAVPVLDVETSCRRVAEIKGGIVTSKERCMAQEQSARDELRAQWSQFHRGDQQLCLSQTRIGGLPSYVELLECISIARDARALEAGKRGGTVGSGTPDRR